MIRWPKIAIGGAIVLMLVLGGAFAERLAPFDPAAQNVREKLRPPMTETASGAMHRLGTDYLGRDVLSRAVYGSRVSLIVGLVSVALSAFAGALLGAIGGYYGGLI